MCDQITVLSAGVQKSHYCLCFVLCFVFFFLKSKLFLKWHHVVHVMFCRVYILYLAKKKKIMKQKSWYFWLLTLQSCKSVFRYLTTCTIKLELYHIFAEIVQIKRDSIFGWNPVCECVWVCRHQDEGGVCISFNSSEESILLTKNCIKWILEGLFKRIQRKWWYRSCQTELKELPRKETGRSWIFPGHRSNARAATPQTVVALNWPRYCNHLT